MAGKRCLASAWDGRGTHRKDEGWRFTKECNVQDQGVYSTKRERGTPMQSCALLRSTLLSSMFVTGLCAQSDLATVTGVVTDSAAAIMPGVSVTIRNTDTNEPRTILTNPEGIYTITSLPPGPYVLVAEKGGFHSYRETGIVLETGQTLRNDIKLEVGSVSETVS